MIEHLFSWAPNWLIFVIGCSMTIPIACTLTSGIVHLMEDGGEPEKKAWYLRWTFLWPVFILSALVCYLFAAEHGRRNNYYPGPNAVATPPGQN